MKIRPMHTTDKPEVLNIIRRFLGDHAETMVAPWEPAYVAEMDGRIVGYVSAKLMGGRAHGRNFVVHPTWRGTSTFVRMVQALEQDLVKQGIYRYRGILRKADPYFPIIAQKWGGRIVGENDDDYEFEVNILTRKGARGRETHVSASR